MKYPNDLVNWAVEIQLELRPEGMRKSHKLIIVGIEKLSE